MNKKFCQNQADRTVPERSSQFGNQRIKFLERKGMFKTSQKKKAALYLGLVAAGIMCAVDLNLIDGVAFQAAQVASSITAVGVKIGIVAKHLA